MIGEVSLSMLLFDRLCIFIVGRKDFKISFGGVLALSLDSVGRVYLIGVVGSRWLAQDLPFSLDAGWIVGVWSEDSVFLC